MTVSKQIGIFLVALSVSLFALELGEGLSIPGIGSFTSTAEARVGRPLTPVSVAGLRVGRYGAVRARFRAAAYACSIKTSSIFTIAFRPTRR
jgi:hypothetical protein